jgi:hypothetical protein
MVNAGTGFAMSSEPNAQPGGRIYGRDLNCPHFLSQKGWPSALPIARSLRHPSWIVGSCLLDRTADRSDGRGERLATAAPQPTPNPHRLPPRIMEAAMIIETKLARRVLCRSCSFLHPQGQVPAQLSPPCTNRSRYVFVRLLVAMPGSKNPMGPARSRRWLDWRRDRQFQRYV